MKNSKHLKIVFKKKNPGHVSEEKNKILHFDRQFIWLKQKNILWTSQCRYYPIMLLGCPIFTDLEIAECRMWTLQAFVITHTPCYTRRGDTFKISRNGFMKKKKNTLHLWSLYETVAAAWTYVCMSWCVQKLLIQKVHFKLLPFNRAQGLKNVWLLPYMYRQCKMSALCLNGDT